MNKLQYQTNQSRLKGVFIAVVPAILSAAFIVALIMTSINADYLDFPGDWIKMVLLLSLVFGPGQVIATFSAVAVWVVFHKLGLRHWSLAVAVGFVVPFIAIYVWAVDAPDTSYHLVDGAALASLLAVWGGALSRSFSGASPTGGRKFHP